jgi:hypothetical protein
MSKTLSTLITEDRVATAKCPRCDGRVTVPQEVSWVEWRNRYLPGAYCHICGVDFHWYTEEHPSGKSVYPGESTTNVWFCDRVLDAPAPTIVEE